MEEIVPAALTWQPLDSIYRLILALGIGLFIGVEREWRGKEAGLRTFGFSSLLCAIGALLGDSYAITTLALLGIPVFFLNWQSMKEGEGVELTTSAAMLIAGACGVLCGKGHTITPAAIGVTTAGLLTWKERLAGFSHNLTAEEVRAEILLGILAFAIYPILPSHAVDPWGLIIPQTAFVIVIVIAAIGFVNYILMKIFGPKGMEITAFFGGLVNSRKVIVELVSRLQTSGDFLLPAVYRGVLLATISMLLRNAVIVIIFASMATLYLIGPFAMMLIASGLFWYLHPTIKNEEHGSGGLSLESPFRLSAAVSFALVFLALDVVGALVHRNFGSGSYYFVCVLGGLLSSASSIASTATLISHGEIPVSTGVNGVILTSMTSILINIPLIRTMTKDKAFKRKSFISLVIITLLGIVGIAVNEFVLNVFYQGL